MVDQLTKFIQTHEGPIYTQVDHHVNIERYKIGSLRLQFDPLRHQLSVNYLGSEVATFDRVDTIKLCKAIKAARAAADRRALTKFKRLIGRSR